ncbi:MAG TPA: methyltransferase domain-containing protein [Rariglobus sp.]
MKRRLEPELLDSLPPWHPDAVRSRRDLRHVNRLMGNAHWFEKVIARHARPGEHVIELGSGTGELAERLRSAAAVTVDGIDRIPAPARWPGPEARWHQTDIHGFTGWHDYDVVIGNLILHHFDDASLRALGAAIRPHARLLVFSEPTRRRCNQWIWNLATPLCGANRVTRHDGRVSIAAGFLDEELPQALGLEASAWDCNVTHGWLGAHRLIAVRRP